MKTNIVNNIEIERKWLIKEIPTYIREKLSHYEKYEISQSYVSYFPHIRIRKSNDDYILNFKRTISDNDLTRKEIEIKITKEEYENLLKKCEGVQIIKTRYLIPENNNLIIELDYFHDKYEGLIYAEIEFPSEEKAQEYIVPFWFSKELTGIKELNNMGLSYKPINVEEIYKKYAN